MGLTKEQTAGYRQSRVLKLIEKPGGATSSEMAKTLGVKRGVIINDIRDLRRKGYPIQASSMKTEDGMYQAMFELMHTPKRSSKNTPAAPAE